MQQAKHVGKIVVVQPRLLDQTIDANANYLITGGLGGLGIINSKVVGSTWCKTYCISFKKQTRFRKQAIIDDRCRY